MFCILCDKINKIDNIDYCSDCYCMCGENYWSYLKLCSVCNKNTYCKNCKENILDEDLCNLCYNICKWYENKINK